MKKDREEKTNFSKILPNNQIITACRIELRVKEMTMNEKLTMIGPTLVSCSLRFSQSHLYYDNKIISNICPYRNYVIILKNIERTLLLLFTKTNKKRNRNNNSDNTERTR